MMDEHKLSGSSPGVGDILSLNAAGSKFSWLIIESKQDSWIVADYKDDGGFLGGGKGYINKHYTATYHDGRISPGELIKLRLNNKISNEVFSKIMERL